MNLNALNTPIGELVKSFENFDLVECFNTESNSCIIEKKCKLKKILQKANSAFIDSLNSFLIKDLAYRKAKTHIFIRIKSQSFTRTLSQRI